MRATILRSTLAVLAAAILCAAPAAAEQQDQAVRARSKGAVPAKTETDDKIRNYSVTAFDGTIVPGHIRAKLGERIRITFTSEDTNYSIRFKDFGIKEKLSPVRPVVVELTPQALGTFEFRCTRVGIKRFANNGALVVSE